MTTPNGLDFPVNLREYGLMDFKDDHVHASAALLQKRMGGLSPKIAIMLGSGMGGVADLVENAVKISYKDLPGFPVPTVAGHAGEIVAGTLAGTDVLILKGRVHLYETNDFAPIKTLIRTVKAAGCKTLFLTSACGSLKSEIKPGSLMMIEDHINYMGVNPLVGANDDAWGPRFFPTGDAWGKDLRAKLNLAALTARVPLNKGVLFAFRGPAFETPAEIRMARTLGADAIGMSSVPECLVANHCGLSVMGVAVITNMGAGLSDEVLSHDHTLQNAALAFESFQKLLLAFLKP